MNKQKALQIIRETRQNYNVIAKEWDASRHLPSAIKIAQIRSVKKGMSVLDVGCGNGFIAPFILSRGASYVGLDISGSLIVLAKKKFKKEIKAGAKFLTGNIVAKIPFKKETFDRVFCFAVLHHIPSDQLRLRALQEIFRVLKKNGQAVVVVWNLLNQWPRARFSIDEKIKNKPSELDAGDLLVPWKGTKNKTIERYLHLFTERELKLLAREAKFKKCTINYYTRAGKREKNGEELVVKLSK